MSAPFFLRAREPVGRLVRRAPEPSLGRLRAAVAALFALDGFVFGTWAARVPDVSAQVGAGHTALGAALLCLSLGALACMQLTGALAARLGPGLVASVAAVGVCATAVLPGLATSVPALCAALLAFGAATGMVNVAANSVGVQVEARAGRPILSGLHAAFSFGGLGGALLGGLVAGSLDVPTHLVVVAGAGLLLTAALVPVLVGADASTRAVLAPTLRVEPRRRPTAVLVVLGCIAGATAYGEGALTDWGALHLREDLGAASGLAAAGYAGFALTMACGRLAGGYLVARLGERRLLIGGTALAALGALLAVTTTSVPVALLGFGVVGLGLANVFPLAIARAGALGGSTGIALSTTVGYTGLLGGPPAIGFLASHAGLPVALGTVALLAVVAAVLVALVDGDRVRLPAVPALDLAPVHRAAGDLRILAVA
ncbi:Predicted arabinose efflux permease, MFS family [Klenkia marina]|uniref:Predicted arabinose efflux permease, MFS family n=1 Tax=Klenkia marina TaxID=1960309 RepID=A0A1G4YTG7_9ACTN|nr:MFS transporter [Klenkia marina]SCX56726.1 Predicted arabinose efflux permease, MFS family [Klenkia marina]